MQTSEAWRPVVGWGGLYEVSNWGRVRSVARKIPGRWGLHSVKPRVLRPDCTVKGNHLRVTLSRSGSTYRVFVHTLVLTAFIGPRPDGNVARHGKGGSLDNSPENLSWGTISDNVRDEVAHGTHANTKKTRCPRGHLLQPFNSYPRGSKKHRSCRACSLSRAHGHQIGTPEFLAKSDQIYHEAVMAR